MGIDSISIAFQENPEGVFYAGQEIAGTATITVSDEEVKCRNVRARFFGEARVHWTENRPVAAGDGQTRQQIHHYRNSEKYFDENVEIFSGSSAIQSGETQLIPVGSNSFHFSFKLPHEIPSSFEGKHGRVRYYVKVIVDRPWAIDKTEKQYFTVVSPLDLNENQDISKPVDVRESKNFYTLFIKSGSVTANVKLDKLGFVPGEGLKINATVENGSKVTIKEIKAELRQKVKFKAWGGRTNTKNKTISSICVEENLEEGDVSDWNDKAMSIPSVPPSELKHCSIINISYKLELDVVPSGMHKTFTLEVPLTIGTIPLRDQFQSLAGASDKMPLTPFGQLYPDLPPPSYNEAWNMGAYDSKGDKDEKTSSDEDEDGKDKSSYFPKYPTWTFSQE